MFGSQVLALKTAGWRILTLVKAFMPVVLENSWCRKFTHTGGRALAQSLNGELAACRDDADRGTVYHDGLCCDPDAVVRDN